MPTLQRILVVLFFVCDSLVTNAQIITTVAGNGSTGHTGDGGSATVASIGEPTGCAVDANGNFYIGDVLGNVIRKITPCGIISTIAGTGLAGYNGDGIPATTAKLNEPSGIAFDSTGNMYIADLSNNRVRKVDAVTGIISTVAGNGMAGYGGDGLSATAAMLNNPNNICIDRHGNLYITDGSDRIRKVNTLGIISTFAGTGTGGYTGDSGLATAAEIENLYGICSDTIGNIFFIQQVDNRVRKIDTAGIITTIAGNGSYIPTGDGGAAIDAGLDVFGLAFDSSGNLFISGYIENDIRKINGSGIIFTVAGNVTAGFSGDGGPADSAELNDARGIAVDLYGNLYIGDFYNYRIRKVTFNPVVTPTIAVTASPEDTVCSGTSVTFSATVSGTSTAFTYQWLVNGSATGTASTYTYTPVNGDSIRCVLSVNGLCGTPSSNTINMVVNTFAIPTITLSTPTSAPLGSTVTVNATVTSAGSGYSINWYDNSVLFNTTIVPTVTYIKGAGIDHITATVVPVGGCYDSTTSGVVSVVVNTEASPLPSPGERVSIFPNPVSDLVNINGDVVGYEISTVVGAVMQEGKLHNGGNSISVKSFAVGIYLLEVTDGEGGKTVIKIVKE